MIEITDQTQNVDAYNRLRADLERAYPRLRFLAFSGGRVAGDSDDYLALHEAVKGLKDVMIVRVGDEPPDYLELMPFGEQVSDPRAEALGVQAGPMTVCTAHNPATLARASG